MPITRRRLLTSTLAGSAVVAVAGAEAIAPTLARPAYAASPVGDVVGKVTVGYQGWFAAIGDGSPINAWWHWSANAGQPRQVDAAVRLRHGRPTAIQPDRR